MGRKRRWYYPLVVWFMQCFVETRMVENPVHPVDGIIGKEEEEWYREDQVRPSVLVDAVIQSRIAHDFGLEPGQREERHERERLQTRFNLKLDLVFEEPGMSHHVVVEYELVGETGKDEIQQMDSYERDDAQ